MPRFSWTTGLSLLLFATCCLTAGSVQADWLIPPQQPQNPRPSGAPFYPPQTPAGAALVRSPGPHWAPGGDIHSGMRIGSPYYWSAPGVPHPAAAPPAMMVPAHAPWGYYEAAPVVPAVPYGYGESFGHAGGGDPYVYYFGPGFHRHSDEAHYRFPFYSYRRPWYFPGHTSYNRDTNYPW